MTSESPPRMSAASDAPPRAPADLALLFMVVIWAVNFSVAKQALAVLTPLAFNALRYPMAALVVYGALRWRGPIPLPAPGDRLRVVLLGVLGNLVYQQCFIFGLALTRAGTASVLLAGTPIVTALLSAAVGHERVGARTWIGALATVGGIALIVSAGDDAAPGRTSLLGDVLMILATLAWAAYTVGSRPYIQRYGSVAVTAWTLWVGTILVCLIGLPDLLRTDPAVLTAPVWGAIVYAGALSIGLAYLIWYHGVRQLGNARTSLYGNLVPVVALAVAWAWLGERPTAVQIAGAAVILAGVTLARRRVAAIAAAPGRA